MGFVIAGIAMNLSVSLEKDGLEDLLDEKGNPVGFIAELKRNLYEIKEAFRIREYYQLIMYLVIGGLLVPSFGSFGYFFMMDVVGVSKWTYSMLSVLGFICLLLGSQLFEKYFKEREYRYLIMCEALVTILIAPCNFMFVLRKNVDYGIPDTVFLIFTDSVSDILSMCLVFLPMNVIMTKICPKHIEATSFALLAGVSNFRSYTRSYIGTWINDEFVGVSQENLDSYWILYSISFCCSFLPLLFIWMIPTRKQIESF